MSMLMVIERLLVGLMAMSGDNSWASNPTLGTLELKRLLHGKASLYLGLGKGMPSKGQHRPTR